MGEVTPAVQLARGEATTLANELAEARERLRRFHEKYYDEDDPRHSAFALFQDEQRATKEALERSETAPAEKLTWGDLNRVAEVDDGLMVQNWKRICDEAFSEFESGHRAAKVVEVIGTPWARAQFLSLRASFEREWAPRGAIEASMIDALVQAYTQYEYWLNMFTERAQAMKAPQQREIKKYAQCWPPDQDAADAIEQAAQMAERFHRMYLRTIRAMRDYRRYNGPVVVQSAGQVNVGGQQINVMATESQGPP